MGPHLTCVGLGLGQGPWACSLLCRIWVGAEAGAAGLIWHMQSHGWGSGGGPDTVHEAGTDWSWGSGWRGTHGDLVAGLIWHTWGMRTQSDAGAMSMIW